MTFVPLTWMVAPGTGELSVLLITFPVIVFWALAMQVSRRKIVTMQPILASPFVFFGISSRLFVFSGNKEKIVITNLVFKYSIFYFSTTSSLHHSFKIKRKSVFPPHL